jgi:MFS family permease
MMELSLLRAPQVSLVMAIAVFASILQAMPNYTIPYMMETPTPAALHAKILAEAAAKEHLPVALVRPFVHFQGDINYAAGFSVFQLAWHVTIFLSISAMIFGPVGGILARRYGARLPMILGTIAFLVTFALWTPFHGAWVDEATIGILWGLAFGFYYAASPNLIMDVVPAARQGISSGMLAVFGAVGSALATAMLTPILASHPFQVVGTPPGGKPVIANIPQVYTNAGYTEVYLLVGVIPAVIALIIAIALRSGREPARGGERVQAPVAVTAAAES